MDVTQADAYHAVRGYTDWTGTNAVKAAALIRAQDYIDANYSIRLTLTADEQRKLDSAICLLARDMLTRTTETIRAAVAIKKESKEGAGFKKAVEYADAPIDLYPYITVLLSPLVVDTGTAGFAIGKLVR